VFPQSEAAANRAIEIDGQLAEAHASLGFDLAYYDWDWVGAEREFQTALRLNPNSSFAHWNYAHFLRQEGKIEESIREGRRAVEERVYSAHQLRENLHRSRRQESSLRLARKRLSAARLLAHVHQRRSHIRLTAL